MRLIELEIENMASFRGSHKISFENKLGGEDLFAITGATGSGKSTILACIGLALYGSHYKTGIIQRDLVSLGSSFGKITLTFSQKDQIYKARWHCKVLKKDGSPLKNPSPQRELLIDGMISEEKIEDILGLTFDQFCKTVVLNQGEFARFLTASFSERRDILDKLWKGDNLALLSENLASKVKDLKNACDTLQIQLDSIQGISDSELKILKAQGQVLSQSYQKLKLDYDSANESKLLIKTINESKIKKNQVVEKLNKIVKEFETTKNELTAKDEIFLTLTKNFKKQTDKRKKRVTTLQKAIGIEKTLYSTKNALQKETENLKRKNADLIQSKNELEQINTKVTELSEKRDQNQKYFQTIPDSQTLYEIQKTIENLLIQLNKKTELNKRLDHLYREQKDNFAKSNELSSEITDAKKWWNETASKYHETNNEDIFKDSTRTLVISKIKEISTPLEERIENLQKDFIQVSQLESQIRDLRKNEIELNKSINEKKLEVPDFVSQRDSLTEKLSLLKKIELLQKEKEYLLSLIDKSKESDECFLCGKSDFIPSEQSTLAISDNNAIDDSESEKLEEKINILNAKIVELKTNIASLSKLIESNKEKSETLCKKRDEYIEKYPELKSKELYSGLLSELKKRKQSCDEDYAGLLNQSKHISTLLGLREQQFFTIEDIKSQIELGIEQKDTYLKQINLLYESSLSFSKNLWNTTAENLQEDEILETKSNISKIYKSKQEQERLTQRISDYNSKISDIKKEISRSEKEKEALELKINELSKEYTLFNIENNAEAEINEITLAQEKAQLNFDKERHLLQALKEKVSTQKNSIGLYKEQIQGLEDIIIVDWNKIVSVCKDIQSRSHWTPTLNKELSIIWKNYSAAAAGLSKYSVDEGLSQEQSQTVLSKFENDLIEGLDNIFSTQLDPLRKQSERIEFEIEKQTENQNKANSTKGQLELKQKEYFEYNTLFFILGRNEFRNYALGLLEEKLVHLANLELRQLCEGRYELIQKEGKHGNEFFIIDHWSISGERKVYTLSGGETFLLSLALALALAEMTRGRTDIECFFIDEGFGTLDRDSVEDALATLLRVQSQGKQIGIISHVKELTDQIPVNLNLIKDNSGQSRVTWAYH